MISTSQGVRFQLVMNNDSIARAAPKTAADLEPLIEPFRFREYGEAMMDAIQKTNR